MNCTATWHASVYGSEEALDFTSSNTSTVAYHAIRASMQIAKERPAFSRLRNSKYAQFAKYIEGMGTAS